MDPIESFIKSKKRFSLDLLTTAYSRLSVLQLQKGCVTQEDTQQSLRSQLIGQQMNAADIGGHAGLLFESIITPSISATGQVKLAVNKDVIGNDEKFISAILGVLSSKCGGVEYPWVEEFKRECLSYLRRLSDASKPMTEEQPEALAPPEYSFERATPKVAHLLPTPPPLPQPTPVLTQHLDAEVVYDGPEEHKYAPARVEFERAEPIVRLLAQVRKVGMDILFPQSTHDKILAIIFVAVRSFATPAHRELIDMVMTVKESNKVSQLEPVSKTKIRGVLALLKHGELLITQGEYGEPVRLLLAPGIETFKDLRERHDLFLSMYMMDHHLFIPAVLRTELVWQLDEETRVMRLDAMDKLVLKLKHFFSGLAEYSMHAIDRDGSDGVSVSSASTGSEAAYKSQGQGQGYANQGPGQGYGGRGMAGPQGKYGVGQMPGMPGGRGRGYGAPYGGRGGGGRYGQYNYYGGGGGFEGGYGGAGYGNGYGGPGGRFFQSRAQQQRMANAQASLNWANNEDYQEMANEDWSTDSKTVSTATSASTLSQNGAHRAPAPAPGAVNGYSNSNNNVTKLSPQAPSFDPSKYGKKSGDSNNPIDGKASNADRTLTPKSSMSEMLTFDYSRLGSSAPVVGGSVSTSRLPSLNGLSLIDAKDASSGRVDHSLDDGVWLAAAATGGRSNYDFWNDSSSFFDPLGSSGGDSHSHSTHSHGSSKSFALGDLSLNRTFAPQGAPGLYPAGLSMELSGGSSVDLDLSFESRLDRALVHSGALDSSSSRGETISPIPQHHSPLPSATGSGGFFADAGLSTNSV